MNTTELFAGTGSFSKVVRELGHHAWTVDNNPDFKTDVICDIFDYNQILDCTEIV